jgi:hypothetical protein
MARRDRGALLSWGLLGAGLLIAAVVVVVLVFRSPSRPHVAPTTTSAAPPPPSTTTAPPATTAPPPPSPNRVAAVTPFTATIVWRTDQATTGRVGLARVGGPVTLWSQPVGPSLDHSVTMRGLTLDSDYRAEVAGHELAFHTPRPNGALVAGIADGSLTLDGSPFFPLMIWGACPTTYGNLVAAGINLLAQNPCGGTNAQVDALAGAALSAGIAGDAEAENPQLIGTFLPDEADIHGLTAKTVPQVPPSTATGRVTFLTLSNHVYSRAAPTQFGRAMYPGLIAKADVVGFDLYPLQSWCLKTEIDDVYDAQRELVGLAPGKVTFQWIEAGPLDCGARGGRVTPAVIRAESWLAIAAGARGLGFFPNEWTPENAAAVSDVTSTIDAIAPALLAPAVAASADAPLRVAAHMLNGAVYVVVVNPTRRAVHAHVAVPALGNAHAQVVGGGSVAARGGSFSDSFPALAARVYIAPPASP